MLGWQRASLRSTPWAVVGRLSKPSDHLRRSLLLLSVCGGITSMCLVCLIFLILERLGESLSMPRVATHRILLVLVAQAELPLIEQEP